jgi:hypothetical protein
VFGNKITCESLSSKGTITSPTVSEATVTYEGCVEGSSKCTSAGQAAGTIVTSLLSATNVYLDAAETKAGQRFKPKTATKFAEFECGSNKREVTGEVLGEAKPLEGEDSTSGELVFEQEKGKQKYTKVGTEEKIFLKAFGFVQSGIGAGSASQPLTENVTFAKAIKLHKS